MKRTKVSIKSTKGFHLVRIGKGTWVFDTLSEALNYAAGRFVW